MTVNEIITSVKRDLDFCQEKIKLGDGWGNRDYYTGRIASYNYVLNMLGCYLEKAQSGTARAFAIGDVVKHKVSGERGVITALPDKDSLYYYISVGFGRVHSVRGEVLERISQT